MLVDRSAGGVFPWGTFVVNMVGCLLFGLVYSALEHRLDWPGDVRGIVLTGFLGAFTTYSTFAFNSAELVRQSHYAIAAANVASQTFLGILFVFAGLAIGKSI